jgi:hypothetical protein
LSALLYAGQFNILQVGAFSLLMASTYHAGFTR